MTDQQNSPHPVPPPPALPPKSGCATAIMVVIGLVLLLPGLCVTILLVNVPGHIAYEEKILIAICAVVAAAGLALIVKAVR